MTVSIVHTISQSINETYKAPNTTVCSKGLDNKVNEIVTSDRLCGKDGTSVSVTMVEDNENKLYFVV